MRFGSDCVRVWCVCVGYVGDQRDLSQHLFVRRPCAFWFFLMSCENGLGGPCGLVQCSIACVVSRVWGCFWLVGFPILLEVPWWKQQYRLSFLHIILPGCWLAMRDRWLSVPRDDAFEDKGVLR